MLLGRSMTSRRSVPFSRIMTSTLSWAYACGVASSMLNRSVAGISGDSLIVNLPGKAQAVKESLRFLLPELVHAVKVIKGEA